MEFLQTYSSEAIEKPVSQEKCYLLKSFLWRTEISNFKFILSMKKLKAKFGFCQSEQIQHLVNVTADFKYDVTICVECIHFSSEKKKLF